MSEEMSDEGVTCACPRLDAKACLRVRYGRDLRDLFSDEPPAGGPDDDEECECGCHDDVELDREHYQDRGGDGW